MRSHSQDFAQIAPVLFQYDLYAENVERLGNVYKISGYSGTFALKKTGMTPVQADWFNYVIRKLERTGYPFFVPVMPTKYGDRTFYDGSDVYYLMPWYKDHTQFRHPADPQETITVALAKLHGLTEKNEEFGEKAAEESFSLLKKRWDARLLEIEKYADMIERHNYLSPFELAFLSHFERVKQMAAKAEDHLKTWQTVTVEKGKSRKVLCHGRPNRGHVCFDDYGTAYFLNFEKAVEDTPARDLALLFRHFFQVRPWDEHDGRHWLTHYEKHFAFFKEERHLFMSYLLFPENVFKMADRYRSNDGKTSELELVRKLERRLLTMNRVHRFVNTLEGEEQNRDGSHT